MSFRSTVLKIEAQKRVQALTREAMGEAGGSEMPMLTAQENGGLSETLLATSIKYMGGVIKNENINAFRRSIFR